MHLSLHLPPSFALSRPLSPNLSPSLYPCVAIAARVCAPPPPPPARAHHILIGNNFSGAGTIRQGGGTTPSGGFDLSRSASGPPSGLAFRPQQARQRNPPGLPPRPVPTALPTPPLRRSAAAPARWLPRRQRPPQAVFRGRVCGGGERCMHRGFPVLTEACRRPR